MKEKLKRFSRSTAFTAVLFALAAALLLGGTVGSTRAALTYYSETYTSRVQMYDIGVSLLENGERISWRDYGSKADGTWSEYTGVLLANMLESGKKVKLDTSYPEELAVKNSGTIDSFVRVTIYKYWEDSSGEKLREFDPDYIKLHLCNLDSDWLIDGESSTPERTVLYYKYVLPRGATTALFADKLTIDGAVLEHSSTVTHKDGSETIVYEYDGAEFRLEVVANAVQIHNAEDAIWSAWGRRVHVNGQTLSLQ